MVGFTGKLVITVAVPVVVYFGRKLVISTNAWYARQHKELVDAWKIEYGYCKLCGGLRTPVTYSNGYDEHTGQKTTLTIYECIEGCNDEY
jgi:hypothetical protein